MYPRITVAFTIDCIITFPVLCSFFNYFIAYWESTILLDFFSRWFELSLDLGRFNGSKPGLGVEIAFDDISVHEGEGKHNFSSGISSLQLTFKETTKVAAYHNRFIGSYLIDLELLVFRLCCCTTSDDDCSSLFTSVCITLALKTMK